MKISFIIRSKNKVLWQFANAFEISTTTMANGEDDDRNIATLA